MVERPKLRTRFAIYEDISAIVKFKDLSIMKRVMFEMYKKRSLENLDNWELEDMLPKLREAYDAAEKST